MNENFKNTDSLKINITSSSSIKPRNLRDYLSADMADRRTGSDNTMQIYIKRKSHKKVINVNYSEHSSENEKIQIKIEKEKMKRNYLRESNTPRKTETRNNTENINLISAPSLRKDAYGNTIEKGNPKNYKVTFLDLNQKSKILKNFEKINMKEKFIKLVKIESYKSYNNDQSEREEDDNKTRCKCGCSIF